ncbi:MAG: hypothetical protein GF411_00540 [Candidatus Lokiarchaeota archaeon]|nr:hypothetical protein [Candidatus Lokiarchaeota archaeon]
MTIHNRTPFILCCVGGIMLIASGTSGAIGVMGPFLQNLIDLFGIEAAYSIQQIIGILGALTIIGGVVVIFGGFLLTTRRVEFGRKVIFAAVILGVLSLIASMIQLIVSGNLIMDLIQQFAQSIGWLGAILCIEARIIAEQRPMMQS